MSESTGEGYVDAVDDRGEPRAGQDVSGAQFVDPAQGADPAAPAAGTGYASAVDDEGGKDAGEDVSREGYVEETDG